MLIFFILTILCWWEWQGPLRELVLTLQKEVVEGDLLRDCIELGADDLKGLIQVFKDIAIQYFSASPKTDLWMLLFENLWEAEGGHI